MKRILTYIVLFSVCLRSWCVWAAFELELSVREPAGVSLQSAPACGGVPLRWGEFKTDQAFSLFSRDGAEIPCQVLPLVVDEKGFLRWILVDFQTDLQAKEEKKFLLRAIPGTAKPKSGIKVSENAEEVVVDTGRIQFAIPRKKPFGLFSRVVCDGETVVTGGEASYVDWTVPSAEKRRYFAGPPDEIVVEYKGPLRVTVKVAGPYLDNEHTRLRYLTRVTAWAGRSDVLVKHSLVNSNPDQYVYRRISESTLTLKLAGNVAATLIGADRPIAAGPEAWLKQGLLTHSYYYGTPIVPTNAAVAGSGEKIIWGSTTHTNVALGWIASLVHSERKKRNVFVCDRFFYEDPPRELAVEKNTLQLRGVIERFEGPVHTYYPGTKNERKVQIGHPFRSKARWLLDCNRISSEYVINFDAPYEGNELVNLAQSARSLLHVMAPPAWYSETECLEIGNFGTEEDELRCYELWGWKYAPKDIPKGPGFDTYGGSEGPNFRSTRGVDNHYDSEHDVLESLVLMYLRTGKRPHLDRAMAWANFGMDTGFFRSDGWRWKDGGIWWTKGGPAGGNIPVRPADPVTGLRAGLPPPWSKGWKHGEAEWGAEDGGQIGVQADSRQCHCHNYGPGMAAWFCITGEQDAREAVIDQDEQNLDFYQRYPYALLVPGKSNSFSRDFTRAARVANAARLIAPTNEFVVKVSDFLMTTYLQRPRPEPRGFVNPAPEVTKAAQPVDIAKKIEQFRYHVGDKGIEEMKRLGIVVDPETGALMDPKTGKKWHPLEAPHNFMYPMLYIAIHSYYRMTGNEDAMDWLIAHGKAFAQVAYQPHGNFAHYSILLVDFPIRGMAKDRVTWEIDESNPYGEGFAMSGYAAKHWPDACARAYALCGEPLLKQRAYDYWFAGSHRGYQAKKMHNLGGVGAWLNYYNPREDFLVFAAQTFHVHAHPRKDDQPPQPISDLRVELEGTTARVSFTAPQDRGGGVVARYQLKCADRPIVSYEEFLEAWTRFEDEKVVNWWMAKNLDGEPRPAPPGTKELFTVTNIPNTARYFAIRSFDDNSNRSPLSNVVEAVLKK